MIYVLKEPTLVIMEYVPGGDLLTYLRKYRPESRSGEEEINGLTPKDLLVFAFQTARGLQHLENCKVNVIKIIFKPTYTVRSFLFNFLSSSSSSSS